MVPTWPPPPACADRYRLYLSSSWSAAWAAASLLMPHSPHMSNTHTGCVQAAFDPPPAAPLPLPLGPASSRSPGDCIAVTAPKDTRCRFGGLVSTPEREDERHGCKVVALLGRLVELADGCCPSPRGLSRGL